MEQYSELGGPGTVLPTRIIRIIFIMTSQFGGFIVMASFSAILILNCEAIDCVSLVSGQVFQTVNNDSLKAVFCKGIISHYRLIVIAFSSVLSCFMNSQDPSR